MSKYIEVEKLKVEIKGLQCEQGFEDGETERGYQVAIKDILRIITSLQQEQRETDGDDGKFVKILVRKEFAELFQKLGDEIQAGQSSFVGAMNQQEQPEVDLEEEIERIVKNEEKFMKFQVRHQLIRYIARHFYALGRNAKKEE